MTFLTLSEHQPEPKAEGRARVDRVPGLCLLLSRLHNLKVRRYQSSFRGADAPTVFIPMTRPFAPTSRSHPSVEACSMATRAVTDGGRTLSRYSGGW
jgi:hypothetical protein